jgi:hypothetical protein
MPGSCTTALVTGDQAMSAVKFAVDAQQKAMSFDGKTVTLQLVSILTSWDWR